MVIAFILAIGCSAMLAAPAAAAPADPFCDQLNKALAAAPEKFATFKGEAKAGENGVWMATQAIPDGGDCVIVGDITPAYVCTLYAADSDESAHIAYADAIDRIGKCLGEKWTGRETAGAEITKHKFTRADGGPSVRVRSQIGSADAYTVELWVEPAGD